MNATILDLRYHMKDVLKALDRCESVHILYHGKEKGVIIPSQKKKMKITDHPAFGMHRNDKESMDSVMDRLRGGRYRDI